MWLTLNEAVKLGLSPGHYKTTSKLLKVVVAECPGCCSGEMCVFSDLKTGKPVLYFENCESDRRILVEICCNLKEVDQFMTIGIMTVERLSEILVAHVESP